MPTPSPERRRHVQRFGLAGIGAAVLLVGIASPAAAAPGVVIPLAPTEVVLVPVAPENGDVAVLDPVADPAASAFEPVLVQFGETLTVDLPDELDPTNALVELAFDADDDGSPDRTYVTGSVTDPLVVNPVGDNDLEVELPTDDGVSGPLATLSIAPLETALGPEFTVAPLLEYTLDLSSATPTGTTLFPELVAFAAVPCDLSSTDPCPVAVVAGTTFTLDLTADSVLRDLGLTDLTGVQVALQSIDDPSAEPVLLAVEVSGSTATVALPADLAPGAYGVVLGQPIASGLSIVVAELAVSAPPAVAPVVAPPTAAAPTTQAVVTNAGLRSNTGVTAPAAEGGSGGVAVGAGAGLLLLAGAGGVAVARSRRRPAVGPEAGEA
ncbi:hypothetical protein [Geodermatophilus sp. SYSU D00766]